MKQLYLAFVLGLISLNILPGQDQDPDQLSTFADATAVDDADLLLIDDVSIPAGNVTLKTLTWANLKAFFTQQSALATIATTGSFADLVDEPVTVSQAEAEAGVATTDRLWTAERVAQAIAALESAEANNLTAAVTWANVPDANITQSSVTQHEAGINHDALTNFVANEHIDWTIASQGTIHATNYVDTDTQLTQEQVDDFIDQLINDVDSVHTRIAITYDDINNAMDFVVDDMDNTASSLGGGLALFDSKSVLDLRFNTLSAADFDLVANVISIDDATWLNEAELDTFAELDAQIADQSLVHTGIDDDVPESGDFGAGADLEATGAVSANAIDNTKLADMAAYTLKLRNAGTSGDPGDVKISSLTEELTPTTGDFILGEISTGEIRRYDVGNLPTGGGGEANTGSNLGGGLANFDSKLGVDLRFNTFAAADFDLASNIISIDDVTWLSEADLSSLADLNTQLGTSIADGAHTVDTNLTQEEVDDFIDALINDLDSVHTRIAITYDDIDNAMDFIVDDMDNTASSLGGGLAIFDSKSVLDLRFNTLAAADFDLATNVISIDDATWLSEADLASLADLNTQLGTSIADGPHTTEVNDLETADPPSIQDTEIYVGNGVGSGTFVAMSGDATLANTGALSLGASVVQDSEIDYTAVTLNDFTFDVGSVSKTEYGYLNGVTSAIQTQIDGKQATDADLDDLADGSLTGSKVGSGINASNVTTGTLPAARLGADSIDAIGEIATALKTGSGSTLMTTRTGVYRTVYIDAGAMVPRTTAGAEAATEEYATNDVMSDHLLFDGAAEEGVQFRYMFPDEWDDGNIKLKFFWDAASGATAADGVTWGVSAQALSNDDAIDTAFGASVDTDDAVLAVGDLHVSPASAAVTVSGSPADGDIIHFEVTRVVGDVNDDMTEDAKLLGVAIQYQESLTEPSAW